MLVDFDEVIDRRLRRVRLRHLVSNRPATPVAGQSGTGEEGAPLPLIGGGAARVGHASAPNSRVKEHPGQRVPSLRVAVQRLPSRLRMRRRMVAQLFGSGCVRLLIVGPRRAKPRLPDGASVGVGVAVPHVAFRLGSVAWDIHLGRARGRTIQNVHGHSPGRNYQSPCRPCPHSLGVTDRVALPTPVHNASPCPSS